MSTTGKEKIPLIGRLTPEWALRWAVGVGAVGVLASLVTLAVLRGEWPQVGVVVLFGGLFILAENTALVFGGNLVTASPSFLWALAAVAAFGQRGAVLGAALVGLCGGVSVFHIRRRRYRAVIYNACVYLLAGASAAVVYTMVMAAWSSWLVATVPADVVFALVNGGLILWVVVLYSNQRPAEVWRFMAPDLPNFLAFGVLGALVGRLYGVIGPIAVVLLVTPVAIARLAIAASQVLRQARESTVSVFVRALEVKDPYTGRHTRRVARYSRYIGEQLGLRPDALERLGDAALLHDVGKLAVPRNLLAKPGRLTDEEFKQVQTHAHVCVDILAEVDFLRPMISAAAGHHARYDGAGYGTGPEGREASIVAVADAFDAMTSTRAYRRALHQEVAFAELRSQAGSQFDPACVEALIAGISSRGEQYGLGFEDDAVDYDVAPPVTGTGSAGLGDVEGAGAQLGAGAPADLAPPSTALLGGGGE